MKMKLPPEFPGALWLDELEEAAVSDVLRNGSMFRYYGQGKPKYVDRYEAAARRFYGTKYALAINSGTGALITAMRAMDIGPGCEVILPAYMWVASVGAVVQVDAIPVLCEVDDSLTMDIQDLRRKITPRTRLIVPIHMAGAPCNMTAIMAVARKHRISVLEDCAQCNGGSFQGRKVGTWGDMAIFSLQLNKNMTSGEGGLILTNDEMLYNRAFSAHDMGMVRVNGRLATPEPSAVMWGAGRRMSELTGAVASVQIKKLPRIVAGLRASKRRIKARLKGTPGLSFRRLHDAKGDTAPFLILILPDEEWAKKTVRGMLEAGMGNAMRVVDAGLHVYFNIPALVNKVPLSTAGNPWSLPQNARSNYDYHLGVCPQSDAWMGRSVLLPIPAKLTAAQEMFIADSIRKACGD